MKYLLALLLIPLACMAASAPQRNWVKILNYHEVEPEDEIKNKEYLSLDDKKKSTRAIYLAVTPDKFEEQMRFLKESYATPSMEEIADKMEKNESFTENGVIVSLDGWDSCIYRYAFPILVKYKIPAVIYIQTGFLKAKGAMTWPQIKEMSDAGITIGSHTINHPHLSRKQKNESGEDYDKRVSRELEVSKEEIESHIGKKVEFFAYPYGSFNDDVIRLLKKAGYRNAATVLWDKNFPDTDRFKLRRRPVTNFMKLPDFVKIFRWDAEDSHAEFAD